MKRHCRLISLVSIFGMLMFVSALWFKQPASSTEANLQTVVHQMLSFVAAISPSYLAEVKHRIPNTGASGAAFMTGAGIFAPRKSPKSLVSHLRTQSLASRSLWLLNRSILI